MPDSAAVPIGPFFSCEGGTWRTNVMAYTGQIIRCQGTMEVGDVYLFTRPQTMQLNLLAPLAQSVGL